MLLLVLNVSLSGLVYRVEYASLVWRGCTRESNILVLMILEQLVVRHDLLLVERHLLLFSAIPPLDRKLLLKHSCRRPEESVEQARPLLNLDELLEVPSELSSHIIIVSDVLCVYEFAVENGLQDELIKHEWITAKVYRVVGAKAEFKSLVPAVSDGLRIVELFIGDRMRLTIARLHKHLLAVRLQVDILHVRFTRSQKHMVLLVHDVGGEA